jgi:ferritin-like metal-binding protein YciE
VTSELNHTQRQLFTSRQGICIAQCAVSLALGEDAVSPKARSAAHTARSRTAHLEEIDMAKEKESLQKLYIEQLRDLWDAEEQILEALPKITAQTKHVELKRAFQQHYQQTEQQVQRLTKIFEELGESAQGKRCVAMKGIIKEGDEAMEEFKDSDVLDAALIGAAQKVEHYEMAGYGCARTYAHMLGLVQQADLLQRTLDEEGDTDHKLTDLAESVVNIDALK